MEQVAILVRQCGSSTQVTCRVRSFWLETDGVGFVCRELYGTVKQSGVRLFREVDVGISHGSQTTEMVVGVLQVCSRV